MQDRFKFRVWDTIQKTMKEVTQITLDKDQTGSMCDVKGKVTVHLVYQPHYVLMQCTGIKDHTGKLIYEGDIVEVEYNGGQIPLFKREYTNDPEPERFFIRYSDEWACYFCNNAIESQSWLNPPLDYLHKSFERQLYPDDSDVNNRVEIGKAILVNDDCKFSKVIGNIYENPELLEVKSD